MSAPRLTPDEENRRPIETPTMGAPWTAGDIYFALRSLGWPPAHHGWGLAVGSLPALLFGIWRLQELIKGLEYLTFTLQPMPGRLRGLSPREAFSKTIRKDGRWLIDEPA